jgi:hypothetical protein
MHYGRFLEMLAASISRDQKQSSPDFIGYNVDPSDRPMHWPLGSQHWQGESTVTYNGDVIPLS